MLSADNDKRKQFIVLLLPKSKYIISKLVLNVNKLVLNINKFFSLIIFCKVKYLLMDRFC